MKDLSRTFFVGEMCKLQDQFSRSSFSQRKCDLIYIALRSLSEQDFANIIDFFIGENKFAPNLSDFKDRARHFQKEKKTVECRKCSSNGIFGVYLKENGLCYSFACNCSNAYDYPRFQKWSDQNQNLFTTLPPLRLGKNPYEGAKEYLELAVKFGKDATKEIGQRGQNE